MNINRVNNFIPLAREISKTSFDYEQQFRHISIVISGKSIEAIGINSNKTHPLMKKLGYKGIYVHSELDAYSKICKVDYRPQRYTLINFRFNRDGRLRLSRPCQHCLMWVAEFFDEIFYSTDKGMRRLL